MRAVALPADPEARAGLWAALRGGDGGGDGDGQDARERLFDAYLPLARSVAGRLYRERRGPDTEYGDFLQLACAGLLEAIDRFDPTLGVPFEAYGRRRIAGSVLDGVAKMSEVREQITYLRRTQRERVRSLSGDATKDAPGGALAALADLAVGLALGFMLEGTGLYCDEEQAGPAAAAYDGLAWKEAVQRVSAELERLPEREQKLLRLHYVDGVAFDRIALLFGLSKGRISQIHKASLLLLRKRLTARSGFHLES